MAVDPYAIPPYWQRLPSFLIYPLSPEPLLACAVFGAVAGVAVLFGPLAILIALFLLAAILAYGYKVLDRTARGYVNDRNLSGDALSDRKFMPFKQFVVIAVGTTLCGYIGSLAGPHVAMLALALFMMVLPANTMLLATTDNLGESMSPPRLWALIHGIGRPYLGLCACLLLLFFSSGGLLGLIGPRVPRALLGFVGGFIGSYFTVVMFRLMGYALYQYHEVLGLDVDVGFDSQDDGARGNRRRQAQTAALLKEGRFGEAIACERAEVDAQPASVAANSRLHRLLLAVPGQEAALLAHAIVWLPPLLAGGQGRQALDVVEAIWRGQPEFRLPRAELILPLAEAALAAGRHETAARLVRGFDQRFPAHRDTAAIYVVGARLLIEYRRDEAQARRVLAAVIELFPGSSAAAEAQRLLVLLARLAGTATPDAAC
jgi:hypothetical protein